MFACPWQHGYAPILLCITAHTPPVLSCPTSRPHIQLLYADGDIADRTPLLKLCLWRAEGLASQIEVDSKLKIVRADTCAGLIFGVSTGALLHKSYKK